VVRHAKWYAVRDGNAVQGGTPCKVARRVTNPSFWACTTRNRNPRCGTRNSMSAHQLNHVKHSFVFAWKITRSIHLLFLRETSREASRCACAFGCARAYVRVYVCECTTVICANRRLHVCGWVRSVALYLYHAPPESVVVVCSHGIARFETVRMVRFLTIHQGTWPVPFC
jgi:hypothetical protein